MYDEVSSHLTWIRVPKTVDQRAGRSDQKLDAHLFAKSVAEVGQIIVLSNVTGNRRIARSWLSSVRVRHGSRNLPLAVGGRNQRTVRLPAGEALIQYSFLALRITCTAKFPFIIHTSESS